jgi:hypothetical protein
MAKNPWAMPDGSDEAMRKALRNLFGALRNSRKHIPPQALEALRVGNLAAFVGLVSWEDIRAEFSQLQTILADQSAKAALELYKTGGVGSQLTFDLINERAVEYARQRAGELVVEIEAEMRQTINDIITRSTAGEFTVQQASKFIRANLPLTSRDANAVLSYADRQYLRFLRAGQSDLKSRMKADAMAEKYADKLTRKRALVIARTETAKASMEGALAGWRSGVETGLIDSSSQKEWIAEADACDICGPMDGVLVPWDAPFGSGVMTPPQHPNCRCSMAILPPDVADTPFTGQVYNGDKVKVEFEFGNQILKHLAGMHDQASHGRSGPIKAGFANWNSSIPKLLDAAGTVDDDTGELIVGQIDPSRGNTVQAVFLEAAGYNGKPTILSEKEFDALEGERLYRGVTDENYLTDYKESIVQYAGEGSYGNGTYTSNKQYTALAYAGDVRDRDAVKLPRIMEMKMLPTANVVAFKDVMDLKSYADKLGSDFITQYIDSGANPAESQRAEWNLGGAMDWTNFAIMDGVDAVRLPGPILGEYYTVVLNRGQVAINGGS